MERKVKVSFIFFIVLLISNIVLFCHTKQLDFSPSVHHKAQRAPQVNSGKKVYCNGILYIDAQNWCVWLNHRKLDAKSMTNNFTVLYIDANKTKIKWKYRNDHHIFIISPNQHYNPCTHNVYNNNDYLQ